MDAEQAEEMLFKHSPKADKLRREAKKARRLQERKEWFKENGHKPHDRHTS